MRKGTLLLPLKAYVLWTLLPATVLEPPGTVATTAPCCTMPICHRHMLCLEQTKVQQRLTVASMLSRSTYNALAGRAFGILFSGQALRPPCPSCNEYLKLITTTTLPCGTGCVPRGGQRCVFENYGLFEL